ncbi:MAG: asparagine synthase (glutamine-hydrolyzing) [Candidatus Krumholzibacteriia bacterium]
MCGIAGALNLDGAPFADAELLARMTRALAHRGPDDEGMHRQGPVGLGQRRLSILDLSPAGHQPMLTADGGRALVYNGEIYNYRDIRADLAARGRTFHSNCDTEVLLDLIDLHGLDWLHRLNGMFAFGLWDQASRTLMLGRDRLGIKPLYWCVADGQFLFASELKSLLQHPAARREVREEALAEYFAFRCVAGAETLLRGIRALPPGHVLTVSPERPEPQIVRFWEDGVPADGGQWVDRRLPLAEQLRTLLEDAVRHRLISDVPVGTYNSGGVDSTLVTAAVRRQATGALHTFSVGFAEAPFDESRYAQIVADRIGIEHHVIRMDEYQYADLLAETVWYCEEPLNHAHTVPLLELSRLAKKYVTVVLTGEGADELFGGYPRYQIPLLARRLEFLPRLLTQGGYQVCRAAGARRLAKLLELCDDPQRALVENARFAPWETLARIGASDWDRRGREAALAEITARGLGPLETVLAFDRATYLPALLHRLDRTTMASGVEARVPFLDFRLLEWSKTLPAGRKLALGRENKVLLKAMAARDFPRDMIYRRKMGFDVPISDWLRNRKGLGRYFDVLTDDTFRHRGFLDAVEVGRLVDEHLARTADHAELLWPLLNLELWRRRFVDAPPRA